MATAMTFKGRMSINGGPPQEVTLQGTAEVLRLWGGRPPEYVDIGGPADQPYPDNTLPGFQPHPSHPIVIVPPGAIDGVHPEHPIFLPVYPTHPIVLPPEQPAEPGFQWVYTDQFGWVLDPIGGGKPRPPGDEDSRFSR
jgi:hypothetical protein